MLKKIIIIISTFLLIGASVGASYLVSYYSFLKDKNNNQNELSMNESKEEENEENKFEEENKSENEENLNNSQENENKNEENKSEEENKEGNENEEEISMSTKEQIISFVSDMGSYIIFNIIIGFCLINFGFCEKKTVVEPYLYIPSIIFNIYSMLFEFLYCSVHSGYKNSWKLIKKMFFNKWWKIILFIIIHVLIVPILCTCISNTFLEYLLNWWNKKGNQETTEEEEEKIKKLSEEEKPDNDNGEAIIENNIN